MRLCGQLCSSLARLPHLPNLSDLLRLLSIPAHKRLAQNIILDMAVNRKFVRLCGSLRDVHVCEVGPGPGGISRAVLEQDCASLRVIEIDKRFLPMLELLQDVSDRRLSITNADVLQVNWQTVWPEQNECASRLWTDDCAPLHLMGNLPFNISLPLLTKFIHYIIIFLWQMAWRRGVFGCGRLPMTFTFQLEVAQRLCAGLGDVQRTRLSVMTQYLAHAQLLWTMPNTVFSPVPEVQVGVVQLVPRVHPLVQLPYEIMDKFTRHFFHYRQKPVLRAVRSLYPPKHKDQLTHELFSSCGFDHRLKCYNWSVEEIGQMAAVYQTQCERLPGLLLYYYRQPVPLQTLALRPGALPPSYTPTDNHQSQSIGIN